MTIRFRDAQANARRAAGAKEINRPGEETRAHAWRAIPNGMIINPKSSCEEKDHERTKLRKHERKAVGRAEMFLASLGKKNLRPACAMAPNYAVFLPYFRVLYAPPAKEWIPLFFPRFLEGANERYTSDGEHEFR